MATTSVQCSDEAKRMFKEAAQAMGKSQREAVDLAARSLAARLAAEESADDRARRIEAAMTGQSHPSATESNSRRVRHESNTDATAVS